MKKIALALTIVASLASCSHLNKNSSSNENVSVSNLEQKPYETVADEKQAAVVSAEAASQNEIQVDDRVFFGYDSSSLSADAKKTLGLQYEWLKSDPSIHVIIEGHCDERGTREYNIALGEKRAKAARDFLVKKGVGSSRIKIVSYGKEKPVYLGSDEQSWAKNRRVVTVIDKE